MKNKNNIYIIFIIISIFTLNVSLFSQDLDNPLNPIKTRNAKLHDVGVTLGFGQNYANGEHRVLCDACIFDGGVAFGTTLGLFYEREANSWFWYGILLRYDNLGIESKYIDNQLLKAVESDQQFIVPIEQKAVLDLSYLNFTPYVSFRLAKWFRINTGLNVGVNINSNLKHTETPISNTVQDPTTGDIYELEVTNPDPNRTGAERYTFMDEELPEIVSPYLTFYSNFAFPIEFENESKLIPSVGFDFPLGNISNYGDNFNIGTWRLYLSYSYPLITRGKDKKEVE